MVELIERTKILIKSADARLNIIANFESNDIQTYTDKLITFGEVEVGWREACSKTDRTHKIYREWVKIIKALRKDGFVIDEKRVKHDNSWATKAGGFWQSIIFSIKK